MKTKFILLLPALLVSTLLSAQAFGEIHGMVLSPTGEPAAYVTVRAFDGVSIAGGDQTDEDGHFKIKPLRPGMYSVRFNSAEFAPAEAIGISVEPEKITKMDDVHMQGSDMDPIVITPKPKLISYDGSTLLTMKYADFKNMASFKGGDLKKMTTAMGSDIKVSADGSELYFRGSRSGSVIYYIDGMKVRGNPPSTPSSSISSLSVYTGGVPAKYGDSTGGIIVVETKSYLEEFYRKQNGN